LTGSSPLLMPPEPQSPRQVVESARRIDLLDGPPV
jgi:hypothetical protein